MAASGDSTSQPHAPATAAIVWSAHPSNDLGIFSPDLLRMCGHHNGNREKKTDELGTKQYGNGGSEDIPARMKNPTHILIVGIGLYIDGSESYEVLLELARLKANSLVIRYNNWLITSSECQTSTILPDIPRSRMPCVYVPNAGGAFFGSLVLQKSFYVKNKDMCSATLVYSRVGWLMFQSVPISTRLGCESTIMFLMNPFTGEMLTLPPAPEIGCVRAKKAAFTICDGRPDLVVFPCLYGRYIRILLIRPGDEKWEEHTTKVISKHVGMWDSLLCGRCVYCFFDHGEILIVFHLDRLDWSTYNCLDIGMYLLEFEGKILCVDPPLSHVHDGDKEIKAKELIIHQGSASFLRLNDMELSNRLWFLGPKQSFCARMMGQKVYRLKMTLCGERDEGMIRTEHSVLNDKYCVYYHDLLKKNYAVLTPDTFSNGHTWVDLGGVLVTRRRRTQPTMP